MDGLQYIMENPIKMDDLGGFPPIFGNIHMSILYSSIFKFKITRETKSKKPAPTAILFKEPATHGSWRF